MMNALNNNESSSRNNPEKSSRATKRLTNLISAASAFGNLGEEADSQGPSSSPSESSSKSKSIYYSNGAKGLAAASQQQQTFLGGNKNKIAQHTEANKAQAHATQEEVHKKMMLVMQNPQLWLQFKSRLAASDHGGGSMGVQMVLQEFIADHPEIEEQLMQESTKQQQAAASHTKSRRSSILETVSKFSMDLSNEASMRGSITPASFPAELRRSIHQHYEDDQGRRSINGKGLSEHNNDASKSNGFMNSASEIGRSFLRRASAAASSSLSTSTSGFDAEAMSSLSSINTTGTDKSMSLNGHSSIGSVEYSQANLLVPFNEQEEDGYVSTDGDDEPLEDFEDSLVDDFDELNTSQHKNE